MDIGIMEIRTILVNNKKLINVTANEGKVLTNGSVYSTNIYLGNNDSIENWDEISADSVPQEDENVYQLKE